MDTKSLQGVEIFSVGTWNGDHYTQKDLDEMVRAFHENPHFKPPMKIGHDDNQKLLQKDGMPAAGWIHKLSTANGKLIADIVDIPGKVFDLIKSGAYKNRSSEILWNANINGKMYPRMLSGLALLGADMPAVTNLAAIEAMYAIEGSEIKAYDFNADGLIIKSYKNLNGGNEMSKSDMEIKLEQELEEAKQKYSRLSEEKSQLEKELEQKQAESEELKKFKAEAEAKAIEAAKALADVELEKELSSLQNEKLISPAMRPYVKALLSEEKKEYAFQKDKSEEKFSKNELVKHILKLYSAASSVNVDESSEANQVEGNTDEALNQKIEQYAKEHKVSYSQAYKVICK